MIRQFKCIFTLTLIAQQFISSSCFLSCQKPNDRWRTLPSKTPISFSLKPGTTALNPLRFCTTYKSISPLSVVTFLDSSSENESRSNDENRSSEKEERSVRRAGGRAGGRKPKIFQRRLSSKNNKSRVGVNFPDIFKKWVPFLAGLWILKAILFSGSPSYYYYYESSSIYETTQNNNQNIVRREEKVRTNIPNLSKPKSSTSSIQSNHFLILDNTDIDM